MNLLRYSLVLLTPAIILMISLLAHHERTGDGSEYIAMYYAWLDTGRPWLSTTSGASYEAIRLSDTILGVVPYEIVLKAFQSLRLGDGLDTTHFWFFSAIAAAIGSVAKKVGGFTDPSYAFAIEHAILALLAGIAALRLFGVAGVLTVAFLLLGSPMLWFTDKIHTEFFTVSLCLIAVLGLLGGKLSWATLAFAAASTQNPSFAIVAAATGLTWLFSRERPTRVDIAFVVAAAVLTCLHPLYYFSRFGGFTPQLIYNGARFAWEPLLSSYIWFIDPDLGLFPNWPGGIAVIILAAIAVSRGARLPVAKKAYALLGLLFIVNLIAHSATVLMNSGGSLDVARYATWYIPFFAPLLIVVLQRALPSMSTHSNVPLKETF